MTITPLSTPLLPEKENIIFPPGDIESDEPPLENELHLRQIIILLQCLEGYWISRNDFYACGNLTIYYSPTQSKSTDFRGPDFFVVLGTPRKVRKSWVVWQEGGKYPNVIVEIVSPSTGQIDRGLKKQIYQDIFRTPNYFWFEPEGLELKGFRLVAGKYEQIAADDRGLLWSEQLELYLGVEDNKLRLFTDDGQLVPTPEELAAAANQKVITESQRAEQANQRAEQANQRAEQANQRAEQANQRAEQANQRAITESTLRQQAEAKVREMEQLLQQYQENPNNLNSTDG